MLNSSCFFVVWCMIKNLQISEMKVSFLSNKIMFATSKRKRSHFLNRIKESFLFASQKENWEIFNIWNCKDFVPHYPKKMTTTLRRLERKLFMIGTKHERSSELIFINAFLPFLSFRWRFINGELFQRENHLDC